MKGEAFENVVLEFVRMVKDNAPQFRKTMIRTHMAFSRTPNLQLSTCRQILAVIIKPSSPMWRSSTNSWPGPQKGVPT